MARLTAETASGRALAAGREWRAALTSLGVVTSEVALDASFDALDHDKDASLNYHELDACLRRERASCPLDGGTLLP